MRQALVFSHALLLLSAVRALPFGLDAMLHIEERHVSVATVERRHPQGLLDGLSSIGSEISDAFTPATTTSSRSSSSTRSTSSDDDTTTSRSTSTRSSSSSSSESTSTRRSTSEESTTTTDSSTSSTSEETSSTSSSTSETSTTPSSTSSTPAETARASETPEASSNNGGSDVPVAGIVVGAVLGVALLAGIIFVLFKWGPLAKWRENRAYEQMMERTYRPALDDKPNMGMGFNDSRSAGLGLAPMGGATVSAGNGPPPNGGYRGVRPTASAAPSPIATTMPQRAFSFSDSTPGAGNPEQERVMRKPLPTIGTGGGAQGVSPLIGGDTPTGADRAEPWLPAGAR